MRTLLLLLLASLASFVYGQDDHVNYVSGNNKYHQFESGKTYYLLADNVNIRSIASSKADVVTNLPIGTAVKIIEISDEKLRLSGFKTNWYKVSFKSKDAVTDGYVWGGLIAEGSITCASDPSVQFLYGVASLRKNKETEYPKQKLTLQLRACKNNKELSKIKMESKTNLNVYHYIKNYGNKGLDNVKDIIELGESQSFCGGYNGYNMFFWDGKKLTYATTLMPGGDGGYYSSDDLIFPSDKGGEKGKIINDQKVGYDVGETEEAILESHKRVEYVWTGEKLKQIKILIDKTYDVGDY
jgi:hypothetical protein